MDHKINKHNSKLEKISTNIKYHIYPNTGFIPSIWCFNMRRCLTCEGTDCAKQNQGAHCQITRTVVKRQNSASVAVTVHTLYS